MSYFLGSQPYPDVFLSVLDHIYGTPIIVCASRFQSTTWTKWLSSFGICWNVVLSMLYYPFPILSLFAMSLLDCAIVTRWCWNFIITSFPPTNQHGHHEERLKDESKRHNDHTNTWYTWRGCGNPAPTFLLWKPYTVKDSKRYDGYNKN